MAATVEIAKAGMGWSMSALGDEYGIDRRTAAKLLDGVEPNGSSRGNPTYRIKDASVPIVKYLINSQSFDGGENETDPDALIPKDRKDWYESELKRIQYDKVTGELIPAHEIANADAEKNKKIALSLDTMADVLERDVGLNSEQVLAMNQIIDGIRNDLYISLTEDDVG